MSAINLINYTSTRFNNKIVEATANNGIRSTFQTRFNIGWSRRCPRILIKDARLSRRTKTRFSWLHPLYVCAESNLLRFLAPRPSSSLFPPFPWHRVIAHPCAIASLFPCGIGERIPRLWSVLPSRIYIYSRVPHFRDIFVISGERQLSLSAER